MPTVVLPDIDQATSKALTGSSATATPVVAAYLRLIDYQLARVKRQADMGQPADARADEQPLTAVYQQLLAGREQLHAAWDPVPDPEQVLNLLKMNTIRFNNDRLQGRLAAVFTTQRTPPDPQVVEVQTEQMRQRVKSAIGQIKDRVLVKIGTREGQASLAANFPPEVVKPAAANLEKIVSTLEKLLARNDGFVADYGLPSNQPAHQTILNGKITLMIHPAELAGLPAWKVMTTLMHEGAHALDPAGILDFLYRQSGLHQALPAPLALRNAANYEQVTADLVAPDQPPPPSAAWDPRFRTAVAYVTVRISRTWVRAYNAAADAKDGKAPAEVRLIGRSVGAPIGGDAKLFPRPLPIDRKFLADAYDALSVVLSVVTRLALGGTRQGALTLTMQNGQPLLRPGAASGQATRDELQDLILEQLATAAVRTGDTSHFTAAELLAVIHSLPDLISKADQADLLLLEEPDKPPSRKQD
jgi:hypothetical protein